MKASFGNSFNRLWYWYLANWRAFNFSGSQFDYKSSNVIADPNGVSAKEAFYAWESQGKILPCRQAPLLRVILKAKGSLSFNIKMWAQDRANGSLPKYLFRQEISRLIPDWAVRAVETQKFKYYL